MSGDGVFVSCYSDDSNRGASGVGSFEPLTVCECECKSLTLPPSLALSVTLSLRRPIR